MVLTKTQVIGDDQLEKFMAALSVRDSAAMDAGQSGQAPAPAPERRIPDHE